MIGKTYIKFALGFALGASAITAAYKSYYNGEANYYCYSSFDHIKTMGEFEHLDDAKTNYYRSMRSLLKKVAKDNKITRTECSMIDDVYDEANEIEARESRIKSLQID